jgi:hypothetical protein
MAYAGGTQIADPAALRNRSVVEEPAQVLVAALVGEFLVERPARCSRIDRQIMLQIILAQKLDHCPMLIVEVNASALHQRLRFGAIPVLVGHLRRAVGDVANGGLGFVRLCGMCIHADISL